MEALTFDLKDVVWFITLALSVGTIIITNRSRIKALEEKVAKHDAERKHFYECVGGLKDAIAEAAIKNAETWGEINTTLGILTTKIESIGNKEKD